MAHVINLGANAGMAVLGGINDEDDDGKEISMGDNDPEEAARAVMQISNLNNTPDGVSINLKKILKRIHTMCNYF